MFVIQNHQNLCFDGFGWHQLLWLSFQFTSSSPLIASCTGSQSPLAHTHCWSAKQFRPGRFSMTHSLKFRFAFYDDRFWKGLKTVMSLQVYPCELTSLWKSRGWEASIWFENWGSCILVLKLGVSWVVNILQTKAHSTGLRVSSSEFLYANQSFSEISPLLESVLISKSCTL